MGPRWAWALPIIGFLAIYLLAAGLSLSNIDNRSEVEIGGLVALSMLPAIGLALTWRAGIPGAGLAVNLLLAALVALLAWYAYAAKRTYAADR